MGVVNLGKYSHKGLSREEQVQTVLWNSCTFGKSGMSCIKKPFKNALGELPIFKNHCLNSFAKWVSNSWIILHKSRFSHNKFAYCDLPAVLWLALSGSETSISFQPLHYWQASCLFHLHTLKFLPFQFYLIGIHIKCQTGISDSRG